MKIFPHNNLYIRKIFRIFDKYIQLMIIYAFDFDGTLFDTPGPEIGKPIFKEKTGIDWPHRGWWSKRESLDPQIFDIKPIDWVYKEYLKATSGNDMVIMATGRMDSLRPQVTNILKSNNIEFDGVYLNTGGDTYLYKTRLFESLIKKHNPESFIIYDDRDPHLVKFVDWAKTQPCKVDIIDVKIKKIIN